MKLEKIILCTAVALTAFGMSLGLHEVGSYLTTEFSSKPVETVTVQPSIEKENSISFDNLPPEATVFPRRFDPAPVAEPETAKVEEAERYDYLGGEYYVIGKLPKGFKDFESLSIQLTDYSLALPENNYEDVHIPPKGYVDMKKSVFDFARISVSNKRISFETEAIKGISYKFVGKFVDEAIDMGEYLEHAALEGDLIKLRNGKKIAETQVKFAEGGC